jgi:hypothetical protein
MTKPVTIIMIEDDEGHARLIEKNIRRAGVTNDIKAFTMAPPPCPSSSARMDLAKRARRNRG